ncbi:Hypothetical predicted protein [Pelobates cultripes]|uniref:Uncharacterized protein n=1 Tax=Pelobates cultripes TaxID=61616 RepID=A0AAD1SNB9_PELCU|nr:Hypothetical predicted protein [Pelobates cultripes]
MRPCVHRAGEAAALPFRGYPATAMAGQASRYPPLGLLGVNTVQPRRATPSRGEVKVKSSRQANNITTDSFLTADTSCLPCTHAHNAETTLQTKLEAILEAFWHKLERRALQQAPPQASGPSPTRRMSRTRKTPGAPTGKRIPWRRQTKPKTSPRHKQRHNQSQSRMRHTFAPRRGSPVLLAVNIRGSVRPHKTRPEPGGLKYFTKLPNSEIPMTGVG